MGKTLHSWATAKDGRMLLGGKERDENRDKNPELMQKANERRLRRSEKMRATLIKSYKGRGITLTLPEPAEPEPAEPEPTEPKPKHVRKSGPSVSKPRAKVKTPTTDEI